MPFNPYYLKSLERYFPTTHQPPEKAPVNFSVSGLLLQIHDLRVIVLVRIHSQPDFARTWCSGTRSFGSWGCSTSTVRRTRCAGPTGGRQGTGHSGMECRQSIRSCCPISSGLTRGSASRIWWTMTTCGAWRSLRWLRCGPTSLSTLSIRTRCGPGAQAVHYLGIPAVGLQLAAMNLLIPQLFALLNYFS
jgi:hypothetical protein